MSVQEARVHKEREAYLRSKISRAKARKDKAEREAAEAEARKKAMVCSHQKRCRLVLDVNIYDCTCRRKTTREDLWFVAIWRTTDPPCVSAADTLRTTKVCHAPSLINIIFVVANYADRL